MNDIDNLIDPYRGLTDEERIIAVIVQIVAYILSLFLCGLPFFCGKPKRTSAEISR